MLASGTGDPDTSTGKLRDVRQRADSEARRRGQRIGQDEPDGGSELSLRRYRSTDEDSARWQGFSFREGDIVISTRSKHGTTWMQMILLLLIHRRPHLPPPSCSSHRGWITSLSPSTLSSHV